jgi:rhamnose utilization protein RhaD (predicted bifunctional aldolase and dehydrogenase)
MIYHVELSKDQSLGQVSAEYYVHAENMEAARSMAVLAFINTLEETYLDQEGSAYPDHYLVTAVGNVSADKPIVEYRFSTPLSYRWFEEEV